MTTSAPPGAGSHLAIMRWGMAAILVLIALDSALDGVWLRAGTWVALAVAHVAMALGAEYNARGRILLWATLAVSLVLFLFR